MGGAERPAGIRLLASIVTVAAFAAGCGDDAVDLRWTITFAEESLRTEVHAVEAFIVEGGCASADPAVAVWSDTARTGDGMGVRPPPLAAGTWGFAARARDVDCRWYAEGCEEVELGNPDSPTTVLTLMDALATRLDSCDGFGCVAGECDLPDAGDIDAGPGDDAGDGDAGPGDDAGDVDAAGFDAGPPDPDAGPPDAGGGIDAGMDAGPVVRSCTDIYGMADRFILCAERATECEFYTYLNRTLHCQNVCSSFGGTCIRTYRENEPMECTYMKPDPRSCTGVREDEICVCSRPP